MLRKNYEIFTGVLAHSAEHNRGFPAGEFGLERIHLRPPPGHSIRSVRCESAHGLYRSIPGGPLLKFLDLHYARPERTFTLRKNYEIFTPGIDAHSTWAPCTAGITLRYVRPGPGTGAPFPTRAPQTPARMGCAILLLTYCSTCGGADMIFEADLV